MCFLFVFRIRILCFVKKCFSCEAECLVLINIINCSGCLCKVPQLIFYPLRANATASVGRLSYVSASCLGGKHYLKVLECMCVRNKTNSKPDMCTLLRQEAWFHSLMLCLCYFSYDLLMYITTTNAAAPEGYSTTPRTRIMCTCTRLTIRVNNYERSLIKSLILRVAVQTWIFGWWVSWLGDLVWPPILLRVTSLVHQNDQSGHLFAEKMSWLVDLVYSAHQIDQSGHPASQKRCSDWSIWCGGTP